MCKLEGTKKLLIISALFFGFILLAALGGKLWVNWKNINSEVDFQPGHYYALKQDNPFITERTVIKVIDKKKGWIKFQFVWYHEDEFVLGEERYDYIDINNKIFEEISEQQAIECCSRY